MVVAVVPKAARYGVGFPFHGLAAAVPTTLPW